MSYQAQNAKSVDYTYTRRANIRHRLVGKIPFLNDEDTIITLTYFYLPTLTNAPKSQTILMDRYSQAVWLPTHSKWCSKGTIWGRKSSSWLRYPCREKSSCQLVIGLFWFDLLLVRTNGAIFSFGKSFICSFISLLWYSRYGKLLHLFFIIFTEQVRFVSNIYWTLILVRLLVIFFIFWKSPDWLEVVPDRN